MKISAVEPQKRKGRYNIFVDGKFWSGLSENTLAKFALYPEKEVNDKILDEVFCFEIFNKVYEASLGKIGRRPHSKVEIQRYIDQKFWKNKEKWFKDTKYADRFDELKEKTKDKILSKLEKFKYINDVEFAKWWIESRKSSRPKGWIAIKSELISKGVANDVLSNLELTSDAEVTMAQRYFDKATRTKKLSKEKLISRMSSRGFSWDTIQTILEKNEVVN